MKHNKNKGFSLVELIIVIAIMAILIGIAVPVYSAYVEKANVAADINNVGSLVHALEIAGNGGLYEFSAVEQVSDNGLQVPLGFIILTHDPMEGTTDSYLKIISTNDETGASNSSIIESVLIDTFGTDYATNLKLKSESWTDSTIPTLFGETGEVFATVKDLTNLLYNTRWLLNGKLDPNANYQSGEEIMVAVAKGVASLDEAFFISKWMSANSDGINAAFGLNGKSTEYYTAVRRAYNEAFASYINSRTDVTHTKSEWKSNKLQATGETSSSIHATQITQYGASIGDMAVSDTICTSAFDSDPKSQWGTLGKSYLNDDAQSCATCRQLYLDYHQSEECRQNAIAFYKAMVTIAESGDDALAAEKITDGAFWNQYQTYINNFSNLYANVQTEQSKYPNGSVVLTLYMKNGAIVVETSPERILEK